MKQTVILHGKFETLSSFALVNRQLAAGLRAAGYQVTVMPSDGNVAETVSGSEPDIYLAHDHPYDILDAPGRINAFFLEYDYARILKQDAALVERLNHFFDVVLAPSEFVREVCRQSEIRIPIVICPLGVDPAEFNADAPPIALPTNKRFKFLYLGGANERKGTDLLLRAYMNEFRGSDDVVLVVKTFTYERHRVEFETLLARLRRRKDAPEIIHEHGEAESVAGYYTAADCGVFPFRGEGFGLPILEALACGCRVIVTAGGGPRDYCTDENAEFLAAKQVTRQGKIEFAPALGDLQRLMRAAYEKGAFPSTARRKVSASVAEWTWERTVKRIHTALQECFTKKPLRQDTKVQVCYAFYQKGETSWKKEARLLDRALARHFVYAALSFWKPPLTEPVKVVLGESGFALEHFVRAARLNPRVRRILRRDNGPFETTVARDTAERERCGVAPRAHTPMEYWRNRRECELADTIVLPSHASRELFVEAGYPANKLRVISLGMPAPRRVRPRRAKMLRFLFIGTDPFRKGIRVLFEAWDKLQPRDAELVCIVNTEILLSPLLLKYLVRNPNIHVKPLMPRRALEQEYLNCDCLVLPSFEDGFSVAVAEGMALGKPAIVSKAAGIADTISHLENGYVVPTGSVSKLKQAIKYFCTHREQILQMGDAARETAHQYSQARFQRAVVDLVQTQIADV